MAQREVDLFELPNLAVFHYPIWPVFIAQFGRIFCVSLGRSRLGGAAWLFGMSGAAECM